MTLAVATYKWPPSNASLLPNYQSPSLSSSVHSPLQQAFPVMCHWRRVRNNYKRCGHYVDQPDEMIQCDDRYCKFSTSHPRNCVPPRCTETCWQYRQFPEQYNPVIDAFCPVCVQLGRS